MREKEKSSYMIYVFTCLLFVLSFALIFSKGIWFDESYTLALIRHNYSDIFFILKDDMHPPLYFFCLKFFCEIFGYSLVITKFFSVLGFWSMLLLGCTFVKRNWGIKMAAAYQLFLAVIPMVYYFSVQQRCYSWSMFWVSLCFLLGYKLICNICCRDTILFIIAFLMCAYNHIYVLVAAAGIALGVNLYYFVRKTQFAKIILMDIMIFMGFLPWLGVLVFQTKNAVSDFWQTSLEPISIIVLCATIFLFFVILIRKSYRDKFVVFAMGCILFPQIIGFLISVLVRPLYIARYAAPLMGVFALLLAYCFHDWINTKYKIIIFCCILFVEFCGTAYLEYLPSWYQFKNEFDTVCHEEDVFIYTDSSFGMFSYYYPENEHLCFYRQSWFRAFDNIRYIETDNFLLQKQESRIWYVVNQRGIIPKWIEQNFKLEKKYSFRNDFNMFDVYLISKTL